MNALPGTSGSCELREGEVSALTGTCFIQRLVCDLTTSLGVAYAFVAELSGGEPPTAQTIAIGHQGQLISNQRYLLEGTPCNSVLADGTCLVPHAAQASYPSDPALVDMGVDSYLGVLLTYDGGKVIGWMAVMDTGPLENEPAASELLRGLAPRVAVELERRRVEAALRDAHENSERKFAIAFRCCPDAMAISTFLEGRLLEVNDSFLSMMGYTREEVLGRTAVELDFWSSPAERESLTRSLASDGAVRNLEFGFKRRGGEERIGLLSAEVFELDGQWCIVSVISDVTELKRSEERLVHSALHDSLTNLPNRALFLDRLQHAVERSLRRKDCTFAVLFLDLDRFKVINDSLGHAVGDQLLGGIARRLEACLRPGDTVARLGGDEFALLLEDLADAGGASRVAERIHGVLAVPFALDGHEVFTSASIGIALSSTGYERAEELLRDADLAMYRAKATGRARYEVFDRAMHQHAVALMELETDLRRALDRGELAVHYQPLVSLETRAVIGLEALVRWNHPGRGMILPAEFVPLAEETGLIIPLGQWVLGESCRQLKHWHDTLPGVPRPSISVNLSCRQFLQPDLVAQVREVLDHTGLDPCYLHLEITESTVMESADHVNDMLGRLKELGIHLCMDDFGTGYSSLSYLHRFPIDTLKIDRSFVGLMGKGGENIELVRTIVDLGHNLEKGVVAEGVETLEQVAQLRALKCEYAQGTYFAGPVEAAAAARIVAAGSLP